MAIVAMMVAVAAAVPAILKKRFGATSDSGGGNDGEIIGAVTVRLLSDCSGI